MPKPLRQTEAIAIADWVASLGDADLLRLRAIAHLRARALPGLEWSDVFNEAILRLLDGSRVCPHGIPLVAIIAMTMRGVADDHRRRIRRERRLLVPADDAARQSPDPAPCVDLERVMAAAQALAALDRLFARDTEVLWIIAGLAEGLGPEEIRRRHGLDETAYDTARRRMRRALLRHDRDGSRP